MKSLKVLYMGKPLRDVYPHATKFQVLKWKVQEFLKKCLRIAVKAGVGFSVVYLAILYGTTLHPTTSYASPDAPIQYLQAPTPIMDRIADCESGNGTKGSATHYRNGQVLMQPNTNGTVDVGKYQINSVWFKQATALGLDITKEVDNKDMAMWIYQNRGTGDWSSSSKCWNK